MTASITPLGASTVKRAVALKEQEWVMLCLFKEGIPPVFLVVGAPPLGQSPWASHSLHTSQAVGPSYLGPRVSFRAPVDDQTSIDALEVGLVLRG